MRRVLLLTTFNVFVAIFRPGQSVNRLTSDTVLLLVATFFLFDTFRSQQNK